MHAEIIREDGTVVSAEIANLTRSSVFVKADSAPPFRSRVRLRFEGMELVGETALVCGEPRGFVVAFEAPSELKLSIAALQDQVDVLGDGPWVENTTPSEPPDADITGKNTVVVPEPPAPPPPTPLPLPRSPSRMPTPQPARAGSQASRLPSPPAPPAPPPPLRIVPPRAPSAVANPGMPAPSRAAPGRTASVTGLPAPAPRAPSVAQVAAPAPVAATPVAAAPVAATPVAAAPVAAAPVAAAPVAAAPPSPVAPPRSASVIPPGLPELGPDGLLRFGAAGDFALQFKSNIMHGGIIARSSPLGVGTFHVIKLAIPGVMEMLELRARVGFVGDGTVGFMIDSFPVEKPRLESLLAKVPSA